MAGNPRLNHIFVLLVSCQFNVFFTLFHSLILDVLLVISQNMLTLMLPPLEGLKITIIHGNSASPTSLYSLSYQSCSPAFALDFKNLQGHGGVLFKFAEQHLEVLLKCFRRGATFAHLCFWTPNTVRSSSVFFIPANASFFIPVLVCPLFVFFIKSAGLCYH